MEREKDASHWTKCRDTREEKISEYNDFGHKGILYVDMRMKGILRDKCLNQCNHTHASGEDGNDKVDGELEVGAVANNVASNGEDNARRPKGIEQRRERDDVVLHKVSDQVDVEVVEAGVNQGVVHHVDSKTRLFQRAGDLLNVGVGTNKIDDLLVHGVEDVTFGDQSFVFLGTLEHHGDELRQVDVVFLEVRMELLVVEEVLEVLTLEDAAHNTADSTDYTSDNRRCGGGCSGRSGPGGGSGPRCGCSRCSSGTRCSGSGSGNSGCNSGGGNSGGNTGSGGSRSSSSGVSGSSGGGGSSGRS